MQDRAPQLSSRTRLHLVPDPVEDPGHQPVRVVVVDDHPLVRDTVRIVCEADGGVEVVAEAGTGQAALEACARHQPDVLVLDFGLPGMDGLEVARRLKAEHSSVRILILTGSEESETLFESRRIGIDAYVEKDARVAELPAAIKSVAEGTWSFSTLQERRANQHLASMIKWARETSRVLSKLTPRELDVLRAISSGATTRQAAARLNLSQRTVESHIAKLYSKLGARTRVQAIVQATRLGLLDATSATTGTAVPAAWREGGK